MKNLLNKIKLLAALLVWTVALNVSFAQQNYVHQVIVVNEGRYDYIADSQVTFPSIGAYDPVSGNYENFDTIYEMRWASDVVVDSQNIYVAGDTLLLVYNKDTYQKINAVGISGIRKLALWKDQILVSRKSGFGYSAYFQAYDKINLNLIFELDTLNGPQYSSEGMAVYNDTCYLAVNNGFEWGNYKGLLGLIDLNNQNYVVEIDLGPDGLNPDNVMIDGSNIYTLNNKNWSGSSITGFNTSDRSYQTTNLSAPSGCGSSVFASDRVYYHRYDYDQSWVDTNKLILRFNTLDQTIDTTLAKLSGIYGMVTDEINSQIYVTTTDYVTFGTTYIMQFDGTIIDSFAVGISPGSMALDVRKTTSTENLSKPLSVKVYPNPTFSTIILDFYTDIQLYKLYLTDMLGKVIYKKDVRNVRKTHIIDINDYSQGIYFLIIETNQRKSIYKIVKY